MIRKRKPDSPAGPDQHQHYGSLAGVNSYLAEIESSGDDEELVSALARRVVEERAFSTAANLAIRDNATELDKALFRQVVEDGKYRHLVAADVPKHFVKYSQVLGEKLGRKFLKSFDAWSDILDLREGKWESDISSAFLRESKAAETEIYLKSVAAITNALSEFGPDDWLKVLSGQRPASELFTTILDLGEDLTFANNFYDGLLAYADSLLSDEMTPEDISEHWHQLPACLSETRRGHFFIRIRDRLVDKSPVAQKIVSLLAPFGSEAIVLGKFESKAGDIARAIIDPLLASRSAESSGYLSKNAAAFRGVIAGAPKQEKDTLTSRLASWIEESSDETRPDVVLLSESLGLELSFLIVPNGENGKPAEASKAEDDADV